MSGIDLIHYILTHMSILYEFVIFIGLVANDQFVGLRVFGELSVGGYSSSPTFLILVRIQITEHYSLSTVLSCSFRIWIIHTLNVVSF